jgi:magnesium-protoporphyrin O-methyltransferase
MKAFDGAGAVRSYFEGIGFERFRRLHGDEHCSRLQKAVREGHDITLLTVLDWLGVKAGLDGVSICDAGCGAGALSIALAQAGADVHAVDFSRQMVGYAQRRAHKMGVPVDNLEFEVADLADVRGQFDTVVCIDVFARYPLQRVVELLTRLSRLAQSRLILTFTPKTLFDWPLLKLGNLYAQRHDLPALYTHPTQAIGETIEALGWQVRRQKSIASRFNLYYCCVLELVRDGDERLGVAPC